MWEAIISYINSPNSVTLLLCLALVIFVLVKTKVMRVKTNHISIGNDDERDIIRQQTEYAHVFIMSLMNEITFDDNDTYHTRYVLECVYDEVVNWIVFNHFNLNNAYIDVKTNSLYAKICTIAEHKEVQTDEFKQRVHAWVYTLVKQLIEIREIHK